MKLRPLLIVLIGLAVAVGRPAAAQDQPPSPCRFTVSTAATTQPKITGPEDVTSRLIVVDQPGSPVEITDVDSTGTDLRASLGNYTIQDDWRVTVRNRSDRPINAFTVMMSLPFVKHTANGDRMDPQGGGSGKQWNGVLMPGAATVVTLKGSGGSGSARDATDVRVTVSIDRVEFPDCWYRPAKATPK